MKKLPHRLSPKMKTSPWAKDTFGVLSIMAINFWPDDLCLRCGAKNHLTDKNYVISFAAPVHGKGHEGHTGEWGDREKRCQSQETSQLSLQGHGNTFNASQSESKVKNDKPNAFHDATATPLHFSPAIFIVPVLNQLMVVLYYLGQEKMAITSQIAINFSF